MMPNEYWEPIYLLSLMSFLDEGWVIITPNDEVIVAMEIEP